MYNIIKRDIIQWLTIDMEYNLALKDEIIQVAKDDVA